MLTSLRESFMEGGVGGGERNGEGAGEKENNRQKSTSGEYYGHSLHFPFNKNCLYVLHNTVPNLTTSRKEGTLLNGGRIC